MNRLRLSGAAFMVLAGSAELGCSGAFTMAGPATFHEPAAKLAGALRSAAPAPVVQVPLPAQEIRDASVLGRGVLLDLRVETGGPRSLSIGSFTVGSACGPLELRDAATGKAVWSIPRPGSCGDSILAVTPRVVIVGLRDVDKKPVLQLSMLDPSTGAAIATAPLEAGSNAVPSGDAIVVASAQRIMLLDGATLARRWEAKLDGSAARSKIATIGGTLLVIGGGITAIDRQSGKVTRSTPFGGKALAVDAVPMTDALYASVVDGKDSSVAKIAADGALAWRKATPGILDAATPNGALVVDGAAVTMFGASDGAALWTTRLPAEASGAGLVVGALYLVPHARGVSALDAATGAVAWTIDPFGADITNRAKSVADRLSIADDGLVIVDAARGLAAIGKEGAIRWAIAVRSLPHVHRDGRLRAALGTVDPRALAAMVHGVRSNNAAVGSAMTTLNTMGGTTGSMMEASVTMMGAGAEIMASNFADLVTSMSQRKQQQVTVALAQARLDDASPVITRPISWATGRGVLVVRKRDGAFREIVTGPPDVYEDSFRLASVAAFVPEATTMLTFAEGVDVSKWQDEPERGPTQLVQRRLLGYPIDDASFQPPGEYAKRSVVPPGSFEAMTGPTVAPMGR